MDGYGGDKIVVADDHLTTGEVDIGRLIRNADAAKSVGREQDAVTLIQRIYAEFDRRSPRRRL